MSIESKANKCCIVWAFAAALVVASTMAHSTEPRRHGAVNGAHSISSDRRNGERNDEDDFDRAGRVLAPHSIVAGKSIGEWTAESWQWIFSFLVGQSPVFDDQTGELGYLGDVGGPVFFIGAFSDVHRSFSVPCGKYLLLPLLTQAWTLEGDDTEESARAENDAFIATITGLFARVDGKRVANLFSHREATPHLFSVTIPNGGLFGDEGGTFYAVADGYWLMFKPLSPGTHTISFGGTTQDGAIDYRAKVELKVRGGCRDR